MAAVEYESLDEANRIKERKQQVIEAEIDKLSSSLGHVPTAEELLRAATSRNHPLHKYFTWDNSLAANRWRLDEARRMLQIVQVVAHIQADRAQPVRVRKFVLINKTEPMRLRNEALSEPSDREKMTARAITELRSWCRRYIDLPEVDSIRNALESMLL